MHRHTRYVEYDSFITADGEEYRLHNKYNKFVLTEQGAGYPNISYITQRGPDQHGSTVIDYRLNERILQYTVVITDKNRYGYWDNREWLLDILRPNRNTDETVFESGKLRKYYSNGKKRQIDVVVEAGPVFIARSNDSYNEYVIQESLRFLAHDPIYYDPTQVCLQWTLASSNELTFPITFSDKGLSNYGIIFGSQILNESLDVTYYGTWKTYPVIQITGPLNGVEIYNDTTGKRIKLNYNIPGGRIVTINTQYGNKTVSDDLGNNLLGVIDSPIDLTTFEIIAGPKALTTGKVNSLRVIGSGANDNTAVQIAFYTKYIGL